MGHSSYALQAAIAALHDEAPSTDATDWPQILALYNVLRRLADNPMVALNQAIAAAMVHGPKHGLELIEKLAADPRLAGHWRLDAVRAHLHERAGEREEAARCALAAAASATSLAERAFLMEMAATLRGSRS